MPRRVRVGASSPWVPSSSSSAQSWCASGKSDELACQPDWGAEFGRGTRSQEFAEAQDLAIGAAVVVLLNAAPQPGQLPRVAKQGRPQTRAGRLLPEGGRDPVLLQVRDAEVRQRAREAHVPLVLRVPGTALERER